MFPGKSENVSKQAIPDLPCPIAPCGIPCSFAHCYALGDNGIVLPSCPDRGLFCPGDIYALFCIFIPGRCSACSVLLSILLSAKILKKGKKIMTRFTKEMKKRFSAAFSAQDETGEKSVYCVESEALIVFSSPQLITVLQFQRNGKQRDVTNEYPRLSAPYLVYLCRGDEERAKQILKSGGSF